MNGNSMKYAPSSLAFQNVIHDLRHLHPQKSVERQYQAPPQTAELELDFNKIPQAI